MHVGTDGTLQDSKTKAVHFLAPCKPTTNTVTSPVPVAHGYITYNSQFTYLGSIIRNDLNDTPDIENRIEQATKAFGSLSNRIFKNKFVSKKSKKMLYLAIPTKLLLWGCETWAIKKTDWQKIETFQTKCVRKICGISMWDVKDLHITNDLKKKRNIRHSRQLKWLGKIPWMSMKRLPRKMLGRWQNSSKHSYIEALKSINLGPYYTHYHAHVWSSFSVIFRS